jgi:hypothetical protein
MSEIKFSCPICAQHISCDAQWAGMQIKCPACEKEILIPVPPSAPATAPPPPRPLKVGLTTAAAHPTTPVAPPPPPAPRAPFRPALATASDDAPSGTGRRIAIWAVVIVAAGGALYGAFTWASSAQKKFNVEREKNAAESDGGQLGHIAELNSVLDATDPGKHAPVSFDAAEFNKPVEEKINPPVWTLEVASAKIPSGKANGTISGSPFVIDRAYLQKMPTGYALTVRQGTGFQADREVLISLPLKPSENLDARTWKIGTSTTNTNPRVTKRWMAAGRQHTKIYTNGYVLTLEFGRSTIDGLPARIFVALPDEEKTVVGGSFEASFLLVGGTATQRTVRRDYESDY